MFEKILEKNKKNVVRYILQTFTKEGLGAFSPVGKDIILQIAASLPEADLSRWAQTSSDFRIILQPLLEEQNLVRHWSSKKFASQPLQGHTKAVTVLAFSPDGKMVASGADDHNIIVWYTKTGAVKTELKAHTRPITSLDFSPDGTLLVSASLDGTIRLWDLNNDKELKQFAGNAGECNLARFSHNGKFLAYANKRELESYKVHVRNVKTGDEITHAVAKNILQISFSPDDEQLAIFVGAANSIINLWNKQADSERTFNFKVESGLSINQLVRGINTQCPYSAIFSPDLKFCAASYDNRLRIQYIDDGSVLITLENEKIIEPIAFSAGGKILAYSIGYTVKLLDTIRLQIFNNIKCNTAVSALSFSPDGKTLAIGVIKGGILLVRPEK